MSFSPVSVGAGTADALQALGLPKEALHALVDRGRPRTTARLPDDVDGVAGAGRETLLHQRRGTLGLRPLRPEVGAEVAGDQRRDGEDGDQRGDPGQDDAPAPAMHEGAQAAQPAVIMG
jgi:hypothetical protein